MSPLYLDPCQLSTGTLKAIMADLVLAAKATDNHQDFKSTGQMYNRCESVVKARTAQQVAEILELL